jgi:hypothetical protein
VGIPEVPPRRFQSSAHPMWTYRSCSAVTRISSMTSNMSRRQVRSRQKQRLRSIWNWLSRREWHSYHDCAS